MYHIVLCPDDLQDMFEYDVDKGGETAVLRSLETTQPGISSETRAEKENL